MTKEKVNTAVLFTSLDTVSRELITLAANEDEKALNTVPFKGSWTAAQVLVHITKSNKAIVQGLQMQGVQAGRDPEEKVEHLKKMFLDFSVKFSSPAFIIPEKGDHHKKETLAGLEASIKSLESMREETGLSEIISLPAFGEVTKLELLHFVLYHTQRHIHQLKNILSHVNKKIYH